MEARDALEDVLLAGVDAELGQLGVAVEVVERGRAREEETHLGVAREVIGADVTIGVAGRDGHCMLQQLGQVLSGELGHGEVNLRGKVRAWTR